jgi:ABC-type glycerol-3-phosphate transport system permease component
MAIPARATTRSQTGRTGRPKDVGTTQLSTYLQLAGLALLAILILGPLLYMAVTSIRTQGTSSKAWGGFLTLRPAKITQISSKTARTLWDGGSSIR